MISGTLVNVRCAVCGGEEHVVICAAREVRAQGEYLRRFHRRRLRPGAPADELTDRVDFTQDCAVGRRRL